MPPKKKKQPRNAFFFFMIDYKARCERNGERFPNGWRDVQLVAGPEWDAMPPSAKKPYEDMAKEEKLRLKEDTSRNLTCNGLEFSQVDREREEQLEAEKKMDLTINNTITGLLNKRLISEQKFYLIHVNYFCVTDSLEYRPAEVALVEFCLGQGITNVYHTLICGDKLIPMGYHSDAMQKSEATHKIPPRNGPGVKDLNEVFKAIRDFLQPGVGVEGDYPPMYTMTDNVHLNTSISCVKSFMEQLCKNANVSYHDNFPVYNLEKLFFKLQTRSCEISENSSQDAFPTITIANMELERDVLSYTPSIACDFHIAEDTVNHCSKSFVQRWVFLICDHCCQHLDIQLQPGRHVPLNADVEGSHQCADEPVATKLQGLTISNKPFRMIYHSKTKSDDSWVPVVRPGPPRPTGYGITPARQPVMPDESLTKSEDNFPSISVGRGRAKIAASFSKPITSFADMMRKK